jgi:hypothetical protein
MGAAVRVGAACAVALAVILAAALANSDPDTVARVLAVVQPVGFAAVAVGLAVIAVSEFRAGWRAAGDREESTNGRVER